MNEPTQDDSMFVFESKKKVINASIFIALICQTLVAFLLHSLSIKRTADELSRSQSTLRSLEAESIRLSS
ncbi:MAG: helix-turn-helix domain-containing protein [Rubripirellula sp.]|nr:helix-turn-helix domain-containing protein [Rubripirellula sp.]